ncbi:amino acid adenylation domain-containing protein [Actinoplanes derwentensis]|uniref:Amino acid adenylation domain-containing protein n=2 Tax=Actinoplanes derwentensis TaxID=113562 RepID=A0A1H2DCV8_9ACTN|nr:amino acid adenylation domain-containing protein [Actinoplanes derwentensis]
MAGPGGVFSYADLAGRTEQLASMLARRAGPGDVVGMSVRTTYGAVRGMLAASAAGAAFLPLGEDDRSARRRMLLDDSGAVALMHQPAPGDDIEVDQLGGGEPGSVPQGSAYLMYTSGSTGRPKAVVVSEQALSDRLTGLSRMPGLQAGESILALTAFTFDICLAELLLPLMVGATVVASSPSAQQDPAVFAEDVARHRPDVTQATPSFWRFVVRAGWTGIGARRIWCGGEALSPALARDLLDRGTELWNVYGPTEATIWALADRVNDANRIRLGVPVPGSGVRLIAGNGSTVEDHTQGSGEIVLTGEGIATGYLRRPELTAAAFGSVGTLPLPHYRTGDFGRWDSSGALEFLGRRDAQVKIRGHRLELGEVEAVIERHPEVSESVVFLVHGDDPVRAYLVAVIVGSSAGAVRTWANENLPGHAVPRRIVVVPALPRTTAGKVDRVSLGASLGL